MTDLIQTIKQFIVTLDTVNGQLGQVIRGLVQQNVEDYLDTLADISPEEETRMYGRTLLQSDLTTNKNFRDRLNSYKDVNKEIKQITGGPVLTLDTLENPLKAALIDDSILQLYKLANEIVLFIKDGKIDGPRLDILVERAVNVSTKDATLPEIKDMLEELVDRVQTIYYDNFQKELDPEVDKYIATLIDGVLSGKGAA
jgi:hypothetical protein